MLTYQVHCCQSLVGFSSRVNIFVTSKRRTEVLLSSNAFLGEAVKRQMTPDKFM